MAPPLRCGRCSHRRTGLVALRRPRDLLGFGKRRGPHPLEQGCVLPWWLPPRGVGGPDVTSSPAGLGGLEGPPVPAGLQQLPPSPEEAGGSTHTGRSRPGSQTPGHGWGSRMGPLGPGSAPGPLLHTHPHPPTKGWPRTPTVGAGSVSRTRGGKQFGCPAVPGEPCHHPPVSVPSSSLIPSSSPSPLASSRHSPHQRGLSIFIERPGCWAEARSRVWGVAEDRGTPQAEDKAVCLHPASVLATVPAARAALINREGQQQGKGILRKQQPPWEQPPLPGDGPQRRQVPELEGQEPGPPAPTGSGSRAVFHTLAAIRQLQAAELAGGATNEDGGTGQPMGPAGGPSAAVSGDTGRNALLGAGTCQLSSRRRLGGLRPLHHPPPPR